MLGFREEVLRDGFSKWHLENAGFPAALHVIKEGDMNGLIHNHPDGMWSFVMNGSYVERRYVFFKDGPHKGAYSYKEFHRKKGDSFRIESNCIHEIIELPEGPCTTMTIPDEIKVEWGYYKFEKEGIFYRTHYEQDYKLIA